MLKIGLTGGIGSGKSTIAKIIETLGYPVYISDLRAAGLMNWVWGSRGFNVIFRGGDLFTGRQAKQATIAPSFFNDKNAIAKVNRIVTRLSPKIFSTGAGNKRRTSYFLNRQFFLNQSSKGCLITSFQFQRTWKPASNDVIERDTTNREKVIERINNQMPDSEKLSKSDFVIYNNDEDQIVKQILAIIHQLNNLNKNR